MRAVRSPANHRSRGHCAGAFLPVVVNQLYELALQPRQAWVFETLGHLTQGGQADVQRKLELALSGHRVAPKPRGVGHSRGAEATACNGRPVISGYALR